MIPLRIESSTSLLALLLMKPVKPYAQRSICQISILHRSPSHVVSFRQDQLLPSDHQKGVRADEDIEQLASEGWKIHRLIPVKEADAPLETSLQTLEAKKDTEKVNFKSTVEYAQLK